MKPLPTLIPKHMTRVCEEITTIFRENFRDFHQWADDNLTQVNAGYYDYQQGAYFPTPKWRPDTLYLTLRRNASNVSPLADEWSPDDLIYIRYNPVYGRSGEPEEEGQYNMDVVVWRCRFQPIRSAKSLNGFFPVWSDGISVHVRKAGFRNQDMSDNSPSPYHYWTDMRRQGDQPIYEFPFNLGTNCLNFPKGFK